MHTYVRTYVFYERSKWLIPNDTPQNGFQKNYSKFPEHL